MKKFIIKNLGKPFDGLVVYFDDTKGSEIEDLDDGSRTLISVCRVQSDHALFSSFSLPIEDECLYIKASCLIPFEEHDDDQLTDNPFGVFLRSGNVTNGELDVRWSAYENALTINVRQEDLLLYSHNFMGLERAAAVQHFLSVGLIAYDWDNLIFDLQDLEAREIKVVNE